MGGNNKASQKNPARGRISKRQRPVDFLAEDVSSWWGKTFVFIKKTRVKTWKGVFVLAFSAGAAVAIIWTVAMNVQTSSKAASASLDLFTDDTDVTLESGNDIVNMNILLNSQNNDVVVAKAVVNYDPDYFRLESYSTSSSVFSAGNGCIFNAKPCEIINNDTANGKITITMAKPSPGVRTPSGVVAQLNFQALRVISPSSPNFTLSYSSGSYDDSDVIYDDGQGTDILTGVTGATVSVFSATCDPTRFTYTDWGVCQPSGERFREVKTKSPEGCTGGDPIIREDCEPPQGDPCISFEYNDWGACQPNGIQTRTIKSSNPAGCSGGVSPILTQSCGNPKTKDDPNDEEKKKEKKDKEDPKFTDLPLFLNKSRGDVIWWKAKDNRDIHHYRYYFDGGNVKTKKRHFIIPPNTRPGMYILRVKAYDEAGNTKSRYVTVRVRW
jgi:hypothetical protein